MNAVGQSVGTDGGPGFSDELLYETMVASGVMLLKDGALMGGFWFDGPDHESASENEMAYLSAGLNAALKKLGSGWMVQVDSIRRTSRDYLQSDFEDAVDRWIDQERRNAAQYYRTDFALFVTYAPPAVEKHGLTKRVMAWAKGTTKEEAAEELATRVQKFELTLRDFQDTASHVLSIKRMRHGPENDELLQAVNYVVNGRWHPFRCPPTPTYLDVLLARDFVVGTDVRYGEEFLLAVSVMGYPLESYPAMLDGLAKLQMEYRWANRYILADFQKASGKIGGVRRQWAQKQLPMLAQIAGNAKAPVNLDAVQMVQDVDEAMRDLNAGHVAFGHHTSTVILRGKNRRNLDEAGRQVVKTFEAAGFAARIETVNTAEAFMGSLPGHGYQNVRKPMVSSLVLADLLPVAREWVGEPKAPCDFYPKGSPPLLQAKTLSGAAFHLNLHVGDVGHTFVLGPTGAGKSTLLGMLASQFFRYPEAQVFVFDKGYSMLPLTLAHPRGVHFAMGGEGGPRLCPLADIDGEGQLAWAVEWVETVMELQNVELVPRQRKLIAEGLAQMMHTTARYPRVEDRIAQRSLGAFMAHLQDLSLREAFAYYLDEQPGGRVLDGQTEALRYSRFTTFELEELMSMGDRVVTPTLLYLFRQVERRLNGRPTLFIVDEAWLALSNPRFAEKLREWLKVLRKANCAVILATQSLSDVTNSPIRDAVLESCPTRILLPNPEAYSDGLRPLYQEALQLNDAQIRRLASAQKKRHYFYLAQGKAKLFSLELGPVALSFVGATGKADLRRVRELRDQYGPQWYEEWLTLRGLRWAGEDEGWIQPEG